MSASVNTINIEDILAEIKRDIIHKGYKTESIKFDDVITHTTTVDLVHSRALEHNIRLLRLTHQVIAYKVLTSPRRILGKPILFFKKIIRKSIKFFIEPIVHDQNNINKQATNCITDIYLDMSNMNSRLIKLEEENQRLKSILSTQTD